MSYIGFCWHQKPLSTAPQLINFAEPVKVDAADHLLAKYMGTRLTTQHQVVTSDLSCIAHIINRHRLVNIISQVQMIMSMSRWFASWWASVLVMCWAYHDNQLMRKCVSYVLGVSSQPADGQRCDSGYMKPANLHHCLLLLKCYVIFLILSFN